jgi:hypothetical protein
MNLLQKRLEEIRAELKAGQLEKAAGLLVTTIASDALFDYWTACCEGSERVPKILRYIKRISFTENTPTARIDIREGSIEMNPQFYIDHILGPEDLLFILVHERNHLILHSLYGQADLPSDYPRHLLAFAEDGYINAISRRQLPSILPERFYAKPAEMLLTGRHSQIDWTYFSLGQSQGLNRLKIAHQSLYCKNRKLLARLGEALAHGHRLRGYEDWMKAVYEWHNQRKEGEARTAASTETAQDKGRHSDQTSDEPENPISPDPSDTQCGKAGEPSTDSELGKNEGEKDPRKPQKAPKDSDFRPEKLGSNAAEAKDSGNGQEKEEREGSEQQEDSGENVRAHADDDTRKAEGDSDPSSVGPSGSVTSLVDGDIQAVVPLVHNDPHGNAAGPGQEKHKVIVNGKPMQKVPLPNLKPNDPVVRMILNTCELESFRAPVEVLEESLWRQVDAFVRGVLSERATEKECVGHTPGIPFPLTRRDAFLLSTGEPPVLWQKKVGFERPWIDLYMDVSGSMNKYYPYIPFIYDSLKHYVGKVYQFSTVVVEVDPRDPFLLTTGGTTFNTVAAHMLENESRWAILVSDGKCDLHQGLKEKLKNQLEFFVYIKVDNNHRRSWELIADQVIELY